MTTGEAERGGPGRRPSAESATAFSRAESNIDLSFGKLADAFLFEDDAQIREVRYHEESGELGYRLRFWALQSPG